MDLGGSILIAMPTIMDPRFAKSVILICSHSEEGAMGIVINKPSIELSFVELIDHLNIPHYGHERDLPVHYGGPVERGRGFVLHSHYMQDADSTLDVRGGYYLTSALHILHDLARGCGPDDVLLALGYAGWGAGQLEAEILRNDWLIATPTSDLVFDRDSDAKWEKALHHMGVDARALSLVAGHA